MLRAKQTAGYISKSIKRKITKRENLSEFNKFVWERKIYHPKFWKHYIKYIKSRNTLKNILKEKAKNGVAIFMSTHSLNVAEEICTKIGIIKDGNMIFSDDTIVLETIRGSDHQNLESLFLHLTK